MSKLTSAPPANPITKLFLIKHMAVTLLQICPSEIALPLSIIFNECISSGTFPDTWKQANVQPVHKKGNRQIKSNYRPISLLPICGKILEKIVFDKVYSYLNENNLLSKNQSGFRPGNSTIYQLLPSHLISLNLLKNMMKQEHYFWIFRKHLIKCGMKDSFSN